jgi:DNA polymerase elongation subunit (family B)
LGDIYEILLTEGPTQKLREYYRKVRDDIKSVSTEDLAIKIKLAANVEDYSNTPIHVRAIKNSKAELRRGDLVKMIYVKDVREVLHYDPTLNLSFEIDYSKYLENFFVNKVRLIDDKFDLNPSLMEYMKTQKEVK